MPRPALTLPPGELMYSEISAFGSVEDRNRSWAWMMFTDVCRGDCFPDDPVHQEAGEDIDRSGVELPLFDDSGVDVAAEGSAVTAEGGRADVPFVAGVSFKFSHVVIWF